MLDLTAVLQAKRWSDRQAGVEVLALWKRRRRLTRYPTAASIGAKVGRLKQGDTKWWANQPVALESLAELLACKVEDLIPEGSGRPSAISFNEFPELAPLLPGQVPCTVRNDVGWLGALADAALLQGGHAWIIAPFGSGKSLTIRMMHERYGSRIIATTTRRLFDAAREAKDNVPLLAEIEAVDPATDRGALAELTKRNTNVCVLAPFRGLSIGNANARWTNHHWQMDRDWRERIARWAQSRVPRPDEIDIEEILAWLEVIDPKGCLFQTPGHLLPLLARAYRAGLPKGRAALRVLGREALGQTLGANRSPWVRRDGNGAIEHLVRTRLGRLDIGLAPLQAEQWADLLPPALVSVSILAGGATPAKKRSRSAKSEDDNIDLAPTPSLAVRLLEDAGVLHTRDSGGLDVAPWIRVGIEREAIVREIKRGETEWGVWSVDDTRKDAVDDALGALSPTELVAAAQHALEADPTSLSTVAAVEAVFAALGRRMIDDEWKPDSRMSHVLQELGRRQLRLLAMVQKVGTVMPFLPLTRHRPGFDRALQANWLAEAWMFSLTVKRPDALVDDPGWAFPAWSANLRLADAPKELPFPVGESQDEDWACSRLVRVARRVVQVCSDVEVPRSVPHILLPWVVIDGSARGWKLEAGTGAPLVESRLGNLIGHLLRVELKDVRQRASELVWSAILQAQAGDPLHAFARLEYAASDLAAIVGENLSEESFASAFTPSLLQRTTIDGRLVKLPSRLLKAMLPAIAQFLRSEGKPITETAPVVAALDYEDLDLLVEFVGDRYNVGIVAAGRVWHLDPDRALHEARKAVRRGAESEGYAWFYSAPRDRYGTLLLILSDAPPPGVAWATRWLAEVLPLAGAEAPRVFAMMDLSTSAI